MYPNVRWCDGTGVTNVYRPEVSSHSETIGLILMHFGVVLNNSSDWSNGVTIIESQKLYPGLIWIEVWGMMHGVNINNQPGCLSVHLKRSKTSFMICLPCGQLNVLV